MVAAPGWARRLLSVNSDWVFGICLPGLNLLIINTGDIRLGLNIVGRIRRQQSRCISVWSSWTFLDLLRHL